MIGGCGKGVVGTTPKATAVAAALTPSSSASNEGGGGGGGGTTELSETGKYLGLEPLLGNLVGRFHGDSKARVAVELLAKMRTLLTATVEMSHAKGICLLSFDFVFCLLSFDFCLLSFDF